MTRSTRRALAAWLLACAALVFAMAVVGGVTRLTHSGLSHRAFFWLPALLIPLAWWRLRASPPPAAAHVVAAA